MSYKLSVKAEEDLIHAYREGVRMFGTEQAEKYYAGLERVFQFLSDTPKAARERTEITPPIRIHPYRSHIIVYLIDSKGSILILRIRHGREDWESDPV
jgi:toxin ParE1/3/4